MSEEEFAIRYVCAINTVVQWLYSSSVIRMAKLHELTECEQMYEANHDEFMLFLKKSPKTILDAWTPPVAMNGLKRDPVAHQIYAAWFMLRQSGLKQHGGILGDKQGFGKVYKKFSEYCVCHRC